MDEQPTLPVEVRALLRTQVPPLQATVSKLQVRMADLLAPAVERPTRHAAHS